MQLPFSQACENNKEPIFSVLKEYIQKPGNLLEMGHGTGQHAIFMAPKLPVHWHAADQKMYHSNLLAYLNEFPTENITPEITLEIGDKNMTEQLNNSFDYIYTANTLHIMSEENAYQFCDQVHSVMNPGGKLFIYGPFKFEGRFTSESNKRFNEWLKIQNPVSGIRDFENLSQKLSQTGLRFIKKYDLPANNHLLVYEFSS